MPWLVLPTGELSACFEVHSPDHPLAPDMLIGRLQDDRLLLDEARWRRISGRQMETPGPLQQLFLPGTIAPETA